MIVEHICTVADGTRIRCLCSIGRDHTEAEWVEDL